jgi:hypothetical protein
MSKENEEQSLLDAVNAAVDEETYIEEPEVQDDDETPSEGGQNDDDANQPADDEDGAGGDAGSSEDDAEGSAEEDSDADDGERGGEDEPPAEKVEAKKDEPKTVDPVNDPIPDEIKGRTRERIETLVGKVKEAEQYRSSYEELVGMVNSTGATPEAFGNMLNYMRMVNSDNPDDQRTALKAAQAELRALAIRLGEKDVVGFDPVAEFQDLQTAVEAREITPEVAREAALLRLRQQDELTRSTQKNQERQLTMNAERAVQEGTRQLNELGERLAATDPQYREKAAMLVPLLRGPMRTSVHPSQWASTFEEAYRNLKLPSAPAPAPAPRPAPKQQPLRGKAPAGQSNREPGNALEAMNAVLGNMGG